MSRIGIPMFAAVFAAATLFPHAARAAASTDSCAGRIVSSLPATLSAQGTWCLASSLSTAIASGAAITVTTNNVALDCNGHRISGTAEAATTQAVGVVASGRNFTLRNCRFTGLAFGTQIVGDGAIVESNGFRLMTVAAIVVDGHQTTIRGNRIAGVHAPGGTQAQAGIAVAGTADVTDNTVHGVYASEAAPGAYGIYIEDGFGGTVHDNRIRFVGAFEPAVRAGIAIGTGSPRLSVDRNDLLDTGTGVLCLSEGVVVRRTTVVDPGTVTASGCVDGGANFPPVNP